MCGRTGLSLNKDNVRCACSYKGKGRDKYTKPDWLEEHNDGKPYYPSYNMAPSDVTPVLVAANKFRSSDNERVLKPMMWGLIPPWHKGDYRSHGMKTNNCRLEGIESSKLYGPVLRAGGRCVIVAEGFYEWQTTDKSAKTKQPYYIYAPQDEKIQIDDPSTWNNTFDEECGWEGIKLLHMAGLYSVWHGDDGPIYNYAVITMGSGSAFNWLHDRMPAILDSDNKVEQWLDTVNVNAKMALDVLKPVTSLTWHPVSTTVNNSRNKTENCNKRITLPDKKKGKQVGITAWFSKAEKRKSSEPESVTKKPKL